MAEFQHPEMVAQEAKPKLVNVSILFNSDLLIEIGKAMETMRKKQREGFEKSMVELRDMVRSRTPYALGMLYWSIDYAIREITRKGPYGFATGPIGFVGEVRSWKEDIGGMGHMSRYTFYEPWKYAPSVEHGSVAHWPPFEPLMRWIRTVLNPPNIFEEARAYWGIGRNIAKYGMSGRHMFKLGKQEFEDKNILEQNMKQAAEEGIAIISAERPWWAF